MAKSIHLNQLETESGNLAAPPPSASGSFWEHWFKTSASARRANRSLDEHSVWEKAVNLAVLGTEKEKV
jgi:hypothetical protein